MTDRMKQILNNLHRYNMEHMANVNFGLPEEVAFDALVIAPSYTPHRLIEDASFHITELESRGYCAGYVVEKAGLKIAWARTTTGACNMLDYLVLCGELRFKKLIFIGAVGALKADVEIGDVCTPSYSIAGTLANTYLKDSLQDYVPFEKVYPDERYVDQVVALAKEKGHELRKASVFCTDSIAMEYSHLDEIKSFGTDLIEMETATFYAVARLMEVPAIALLVVSDNSVTGVPLVGRTEAQQQKYHHARQTVLVDLIEAIAAQP
ncbi:MAG: phosphorylase [Clostridia bacterium]|nr:phosphorylase [Clostridia bacterium]